MLFLWLTKMMTCTISAWTETGSFSSECTANAALKPLQSHTNEDSQEEQTWVDHRFRYRNDGSLTISRAEALVTWVNARLKHSRLPNEPELSRRARSASVDRDGSVSLRGPPFCCCSHSTHHTTPVKATAVASPNTHYLKSAFIT